MSLRQQAFRDSQLDGEVADIGKFDAKKEAKKEATKSDAKLKANAPIPTHGPPLFFFGRGRSEGGQHVCCNEIA